MENFKLVLPEHLNHYGFLFGGYLLKFVDEIAWIAASLEYPGYNFVTIGMDEVTFRRSVRQGTILRFQSTKTKVGNTSVTFLVDVWKDKSDGDRERSFRHPLRWSALTKTATNRGLRISGNRLSIGWSRTMTT